MSHHEDLDIAADVVDALLAAGAATSQLGTLALESVGYRERHLLARVVHEGRARTFVIGIVVVETR